MNKKEVLEIRKQFTPANCAITRIAGCYVDHEKNKKMESKSAFLSLPEEEAFKYFDIFKKTLSGTMGKNMLNMEFPIDQEMPGGTQEFLMKLKASKLEDDMLLEEFYDKVIATYEYAENYYIMQCMMCRADRLTIWRCLTHPMKCMSIWCAVSVRFRCQRQD
jgi:hypothetical protein